MTDHLWLGMELQLYALRELGCVFWHGAFLYEEQYRFLQMVLDGLAVSGLYFPAPCR